MMGNCSSSLKSRRNGLPTYLRVVVTTACPMACRYCHAEGEQAPVVREAGPTAPRVLETSLLEASLTAAARAGVRKFKLLGGEPLLRADLPRIIRTLCQAAPQADISLITGGTASVVRLDAAFAAGLDRANLSIHGWSLPAFLAQGGRPGLYSLRQANLARLLAIGRPLKLNYVYCGPAQDADLDELLGWAASRPVLVNVLDDLRDPAVGPAALRELLLRLRGPSAGQEICHDPDSLPTTHLRWADGLRVEIKSERLGEVAPWKDCAACPVRARCKEGIYALRLASDGTLRLCMDRPDLGLPLVSALGKGPGRAAEAWQSFVLEHAA